MLTWKNIHDATEDALLEISGRKDSTLKSLETSKKKLNRALLSGIPWNKIVTFSGTSGSGKSMAIEELKRDMVQLNRDQDFDILSFEFEMLSKDQVLRSLSGKMGKSVKHLLSAEDNVVTDNELAEARELATEISDYPIYYVDDSGTVDEIEETIYEFINERQLLQKNRDLIITIDHILLTKEKEGEEERRMIKNLCNAMIRIKKKLSQAMNVLIIMVSQLNRDIESKERILNSKLHYPNKNDLFGSSSIFQASDYVIVTHCPANITGLGPTYGPHNLPLKNPQNPDQKMVYWHVIKERSGQPCILMMLDNFKHSKIDEYNGEI